EIGQLIPKKKYTKWFDYDKMKNRPKIRYRMTGDKITLKGVGTKTVKSLMIDLRIPAKVRGRVPILADGESVIWVIGYRTNDYYLVTEDTEQILEAIFEPGEPPRPQS
ncbi:MAG: tRNA lysidine(34) synthetase TilS, partial [Lachnospiraceae bacterium]|nr:tRNA lysidine(34) synthetase TilS [Lachnospiraceae bacterium]